MYVHDGFSAYRYRDYECGFSEHSAVLIDVVLEQPILQLVCRKEICLKNAVDWELVRGGVNGLN